MFKWLILLLFLYKNVGSELLNKNEGAKCEWENRRGVCAYIYRCRSSKEDIRKRNFPPICGFRAKEPVICCTDCTLLDDTRKAIYDPSVGELILRGPKAEEKCFHYLQTVEYPCKKNLKIEFKTGTGYGQCISYSTNYKFLDKNLAKEQSHRFPHMAYLGYGESMDDANWLCIGTVISERFILTAAECTKPEESVGPVRYIALGIHKRFVPPSEWEKYNVKRAITHPEYKPPSKYHDIALLETDKTITFSPNVVPACLDTNSYYATSSRNTIIWTEGENSTLDYVTLTELDQLECSIFYPPQKTLAEGYNHTTQMCYGDKKKPTDTCDTEIGSPLQSEIKDCNQVVRGIVSLQRQCGAAASSGLFTRVSYYVPWIEDIVWP